MKYTKVFVENIGYELPPVVVTSAELEDRLAPVYEALHFQPGQLQAFTGISERRWWNPDTPLSQSATAAAHTALNASAVTPSDIEVMIYAGVCRESFEPATACRVAHGVGVSPDAAVYDISNACLGMMNGMLDIANRIELGQIRAGLVVSCESAREIVNIIIERLIAEPDMELFTKSLATLTGGSGAAAVLLTDGSFGSASKHRLLGGATRNAPEHYGLCRWGMEETGQATYSQLMSTDAVAVFGARRGLGPRDMESVHARNGVGAKRMSAILFVTRWGRRTRSSSCARFRYQRTKTSRPLPIWEIWEPCRSPSPPHSRMSATFYSPATKLPFWE